MTPQETYLQHLRTIERIAAFVARRGSLNADEAAEFVQEVRVRLLDDDYSVIRKFEGRSSFSTYLTTVIGRLFHQWRVEQWGKWRPSAEARRLGEKAVTLERLISRDGFSFPEAVEILTTPADSVYSIAELETIYIRLPVRTPRPIAVSDELLPEALASGNEANDLVESEERERVARMAARVIDEVLESAGAEERLILQLRFWHGRKVADIARTLHIDQKKIYKRLDKLYLRLRRALEQAGIERSEIAELVMRGDQELRLVGIFAGEKELNGPSHLRNGEEVSG